MTAARRNSWRDLREEMIRRIATRQWMPGALIPGEEALAAEFGAARATVNRALQDLARAGLVERRRKAGTRVALHPVREARFVIPLVRTEIEATGADYSYRLLSRAREAAPGAVAEALGLKQGATLLHLACLHHAGGKPYQFEDRWIVLDTVPAAATADFSATGPNEWLVANAPFSRATFGFGAAAASDEEARHLGLAPGTPVLVAERRTWLADKPVTHVRMVHPPTHRFETEL